MAPRKLQEKGFLSKVKLKEGAPSSATPPLSRRLHPDRNFKVEDHPDHPVRRRKKVLQEAWLPSLEQARSPSPEAESVHFEEEEEKDNDEEEEEEEEEQEKEANEKRHSSSSSSFPSVSDLLEEPRLAEMPLPVRPWCGKCAAVKAYDILPLKPGDLCSTHADTMRLLAQYYTRPLASFQVPFTSRSSRVGAHRHELRQTSTSSGAPAGGDDGVRRQASGGRVAKTADELLADLDAIEVPGEQPKSRFELEPRPPGEGPAVLWGMPERHIGALELWAINHVKQIHVKAAAQEHFSDLRRASRHRTSVISSGVAHILSTRTERDTLGDEESDFLMGKLKFFPYLRDLPDELMPLVAKEISAERWELGSHIFRRGDIAQGLYWLARGEVLLERERLPDDEPDAGRRLEPPTAICPEDLFEQALERPFALREGGGRWSCSAVAYAEPSAPCRALTVFLPLFVIKQISLYYRRHEAVARDAAVRGLFARIMRIPPELCAKHAGLCRLDTFPKNHVLMRFGARPTLHASSALRVWLVVEGEVRLDWVSHQRGPSAQPDVQRQGGQSGLRRERETLGCESVVGRGFLYGEECRCTAVVASESAKLLSVRVVDYLEKFLLRSTFLPRERKIDAERAAGPRADELLASLAARHTAATRRADDRKALGQSDWKALVPKGRLPCPRPPPAGAAPRARGGRPGGRAAAAEKAPRPSASGDSARSSPRGAAPPRRWLLPACSSESDCSP